MADRDTTRVLAEAQWKRLAPLIEAVRPRGKTEHHDPRRTIEAIIRRHRNGATWRAIPAEPGPWWMAAQTFNRWGHLGVWERLVEAARARGVALGMAGLTASEAVPRTLDGTGIRAHQKAAGAAKKGGPQRHATRARRSAARAAASARRPA